MQKTQENSKYLDVLGQKFIKLISGASIGFQDQIILV